MNRNIYILIVLFLKSFCAQDVFETVEAVVGHSAELPCNATAEKKDDKLKILAWYKNNSSAAFYSRDLREGGQVTSSANSGRYRLLTAEYDGLDKLEIITVRPSDAGLYHCLADFATSPVHKTYVQLFVIEPPRLLWVVHENGTEVAKASAGVNVSRNVGPYYVGETVHLFCVAFGGKPQATLSWWSEQRLLKNTSTPLSEHRVRSDIMYGQLRREDHGRILTCYAQNNDKTTPLSVDVTIDMYLPPELVSLRVEEAGTNRSLERARGRVRAGETLKLQCRVLGARPPSTLIWRLNESHLVNLEQNITKEPSQRLVVSDIQLSVSEEHDESLITCCAAAYQRDNDSFICAQGLPLTVLYPPVLKIEVEADVDNNTLTVVKGSDVSLACNYKANPSVYQLIWFHEDDILSNDNDDIQAILELVNVKESDSGEYGCAATNSEGSSYSQPLVIDVTYPSYCEDNATVEYGVGENESIKLTCNVKGNPEPSKYRWVIVNDVANRTTRSSAPHTTVDTLTNTLQFQRPNNTDNTIFCWGINNIPSKGSPNTPCSFIVTDETTPRPPVNCEAAMTTSREIIVKCEKGHDGGLPQKFKFIVKETESDEHLVSIINLEPEFVIPEPKQENFKFVVIAFNDKGESTAVDIEKADIIIGYKAESSVPIATLSLSLCGGVALLALAACGLVLCTHERGDAREHVARDPHHPPLCAYNTDESNCETYHDSDDGSEYNVKRTDSFRKAVSKYPSKNFDVRRTSSMHSARYMHDVEPEVNKCHEIRRNPNCRVHSLQNINRKREMDAFCDHFVLHLPPDNNYNTPRPMNTFYTMPRKMRHKLAKELSDENSEITQTSDGFSLPPPPDEFGTYRAATRIRDIPKSSPTYTTVIRKNSTGKDPTKYHQYSNQVLAPMNTVGLPTISGAQGSVYTYPDDDHHGHQVNTNPFEEDSS